MNANVDRFSEALGEIDSRYLEEFLNYRCSSNYPCSSPEHSHPAAPSRQGLLFQGFRPKRWAALAACLCLVAVLAVSFALLLTKIPGLSGPDTPSADPEASADSMGGAPQVMVNDTCYIVSPYLALSRECPEGFSLGGVIDSGEYEGCEYYVNPEIPEWIYVYQEVAVGDTLDETGTLPTVEPYMAYLRYVDASIRGMDFVCYQEQLYVPIWNAPSSIADSDIYERICKQYDIRIEGEPPEGFILAGRAEFSGLDTIPAGELSSNMEDADIYINPDVPEIVLVSTSWHTATKEEGKETLHTGFHVYIRYELP